MKEVIIRFILNEEVTPDIFAKKVLAACHQYYALREDESIEVLAHIQALYGTWVQVEETPTMTATPCPVSNPRAVIGAYTGISCGPFSEIHEYADKFFPGVTTIAFANEEFYAQLREKSKDDFLAVCEWLGQFNKEKPAP